MRPMTTLPRRTNVARMRALATAVVVFIGGNTASGQDTIPAAWDQAWWVTCSVQVCLSTDTALLNIRGFEESEVPALDTAELRSRLEVIDAVSGLELEWNPVVHACVKYMTSRRKKHLGTMLGRAPLYFPLFEEVLDQYDLPPMLKYLPVVESGLNPSVRSRVGARGLWQFMYNTARGMDLRIDAYIDERCDPVRSTDAACRYLTKLHGMYDDWWLALAAYNAGPGNVNKAIRRSGGKKNFWEIRGYLPRETRAYVPSFIATVYLMEYPSEHNIYPREPLAAWPTTDTVEVMTPMRFDQIARVLHITEPALELLNPMYRQSILPGPPERWPLRLPMEDVLGFLALQDSIITLEPEKTPEIVFTPAPLVYRVKSGDVLGTIANKHGVSVRALKEWNGLKNSMIRVGQKLYIHADLSKL
jgi:membrane-bound lytic murein transglycosylase D